MRSLGLSTALALAATALLARPAGAVVGWPAIFDPLELVNLNLDLDPNDWQTVLQDTTLNIEVPAMFWADGEVPILVSVRRKSSDPIGDPASPKVALKIDINEFVAGQRWNSLRKVSLENGDDVNTAAEGVAWYLHRLAAGASSSGYDPGLASWVRLFVNDTYYGLFVSVEQRDQSFLQNRLLWVTGATWLYKTSDIDSPVLEVPQGGADSPTFGLLCYPPFTGGGAPGDCPTPDDATLEAELPTLINMEAWLTLGATEAFLSSPDALFTKGKNFYFIDRLSGPRLYVPWDLDTSFISVGESIYGTPQTPYQEIILNHPSFRAQFDQIMRELVAGPFVLPDLLAFIDAAEELIGVPLAADLNNNIGGPSDVALYFDSLRQFVRDRIDFVRGVVGCVTDADCNDGNVCSIDTCSSGACVYAPVPGDLDSDGIPDLCDACPSFVNSDLTDTDDDGIPDECQCGDINQNGVIDVQDAIFAFNCIDPDGTGPLLPNLEPSICNPPVLAGVGDANNNAQYDTQDALLIFNSQPAGGLLASSLTCPNRPQGTTPP